MPDPTPQPIVIRCPHYVLCTSVITCKAFGAMKTEVLKADLCPEARSKRHAAETVERFEQSSEPDDATVVEPVFKYDVHATGTPTVEVDTHFEVKGDENG